jgi:hypothetical protein
MEQAPIHAVGRSLSIVVYLLVETKVIDTFTPFGAVCHSCRGLNELFNTAAFLSFCLAVFPQQTILYFS